MQVFQHCSFILLFGLFWALASPHDFEDSFSISIQKTCNFSGATLAVYLIWVFVILMVSWCFPLKSLVSVSSGPWFQCRVLTLTVSLEYYSLLVVHCCHRDAH